MLTDEQELLALYNNSGEKDSVRASGLSSAESVSCLVAGGAGENDDECSKGCDGSGVKTSPLKEVEVEQSRNHCRNDGHTTMESRSCGRGLQLCADAAYASASSTNRMEASGSGAMGSDSTNGDQYQMSYHIR